MKTEGLRKPRLETAGNGAPGAGNGNAEAKSAASETGNRADEAKGAPASLGTSSARGNDDEAAAVWVATSELVPWQRNPRKNDDNVKRVMESIKRFGFSAPIVARKADGEIIAGHTRLKAAAALGMKRVPVRYLDLDPADAHLLALADNRLNELSPWDTAELQSILSEYGLESAELAGWSSDDLEKMGADLLAAADTLPGEVVEDEVPEPPKVAITKPGDVWLLGEHVLICGDCRDAPTVRKLVGDARVNVAFTSPPYASQRKYDESSGFKPIHPDEFVDWFEAVQANVREVLAPDGSWFVNIKAHSDDCERHPYVMDLVLAHIRRWQWRYVDELAWTHHGYPGGYPNRFKNGWEPIYHFSAEREIRFNPWNVSHASDRVIPTTGQNKDRERGVHDDRAYALSGSNNETGLALPSNVISVSQSSSDHGHPAVFPLGVPAFFIKAYSDSGDIVFDPFMGSGTTLIAAQQLGRKCVGCELSPNYCDVVISRWEALTGGKATLRAS